MTRPAPNIVFTIGEAMGPLDSPLGHRLRQIEERLTKTEGDGVEARWEFGRELLKKREGKQLPKALRAAIVAEFAISVTEVTYRMQFAEVCPTKDEVFTAVNTYRSWTQIKAKALPRKPRKEFTAQRPNAVLFRRLRRDLVLHRSELTNTDRRELGELLNVITDIISEIS